jgi:hypothetical protein
VDSLGEPVSAQVAITVIAAKRRSDRQGKSAISFILAFCVLLVIGGIMDAPQIAVGGFVVGALFYWERRKLKKSIAALDLAELYFSLNGTTAAFAPATKSSGPGQLHVLSPGRDPVVVAMSKIRIDNARGEVLPVARITAPEARNDRAE